MQKRLAKGACGSWLGRNRDVLRMTGGEAEDAERRERESDVEKNGTETLFKSLPRTLAEYIAEERRMKCILHTAPILVALVAKVVGLVQMPAVTWSGRTVSLARLRAVLSG